MEAEDYIYELVEGLYLLLHVLLILHGNFVDFMKPIFEILLYHQRNVEENEQAMIGHEHYVHGLGDDDIFMRLVVYQESYHNSLNYNEANHFILIAIMEEMMNKSSQQPSNSNLHRQNDHCWRSSIKAVDKVAKMLLNELVP